MAVIEYVARADPAVHERLVARGAVAAVFVCMARGASDPDIQVQETRLRSCSCWFVVVVVVVVLFFGGDVWP
jgi:hypothetical protein